ncbi:MAG: hypothetical protein K0Q43_10 [Ramlibacter sp.]|jgi:hypothetical protein|nr:hypothetical protein [Ramlibacter sp.]
MHAPTQEEIQATLAELRAELEAKEARRLAGTLDPYEIFLDDYSAYLQTKLWKKISRRVLKRDNKVCRRCGGRGLRVHHRSYDADVMRGERDEALATVCDTCHHVIHFLDDGSKRPEQDWDQVLLSGPYQPPEVIAGLEPAAGGVP